MLYYLKKKNNQKLLKEKGSENPIILADIMKKHGFEDTVMASSSMDFAKEYGFRSHDGAKKLYKNALNLI